MARLSASDIGAALAPGRQERKASRDQYGTIALDAQSQPTVRLDGGEEFAPCTCMVSVHHGDRVMAHVVNHRIVVFANITTPSVTETEYDYVKDIAEEADELLDGVAEAAATADKTVAEMLADANTASGLVSGMKQAADAAGTTLAQIVSDADSAADTLAGMQAAAEAADTTLTGIYRDAREANAAALGALSGLAAVEGVVGTVNWFAAHKTATADTAVQAGKDYYAYDASAGTLSLVEPAGTENPSQEGWYELDETVQNYVVSHVAETDDGLYVLSLANGWRVLVSSGGGNYAAGVHIIDPNGVVQQSTTASGVDFNAGRSWHVGSNDAYILYTPASGNAPASIVIGGDSVQLGSSKTLAQWEEELSQASQDAADAKDSAHLVITSTNGQLFKNGSESTVLQVAVFPNGGGRLDTISDVRSRFGAGAYIEWRWKHDSDGSWGTLASNDAHLSQGGMWLTVTPEDVATKTSFEANLVVP